MAMTRAFLPEMRARGRGRIINVGSMGGRVTFPLMGAYHATKYAVEALSDALRNELAPFGIHVSLIEPGAIHTEFGDRAMDVLERYRASRSPYAGVLARAEEVRQQFDRTAAGPEVVTNAIVHASERRRPRARYVVPFSTHFALLAFRLLPTRWMDGLLRMVIGLRWGSLSAPRSAPLLNG
jgi:short-subunit dehydrogenase